MSIPKIQAIRGMNDWLPDQTPLWQQAEKAMQEIFDTYHYAEIRLPLLEKTALFQRSIGEVTDIVEKEMYVFADRNGESLSLRPEGTAGCVRAAIEHGLLYHQQQKLWYTGPMFRYERPQKGRYRQFYQTGVEAFGFSDYLIEAELLLMTARLWQKLGIHANMTLQLNSLGTPTVRAQYREVFTAYCREHVEKLDADSQRRLALNPLRILDSKNPDMQSLLQQAPKLQDFLDQESQLNFQKLCELLNQLGIAYEINPHLVRGLDYYTGTVFEWVTPLLGAQSAVCAGGRYDGLVETLGGQPAAAVGFAIGMERLVALMAPINSPAIDIYFIFTAPHEIMAIHYAERLRDIFPDLKLAVNNCSTSSFKSQFKQADKNNARIALILGEDEAAKNMISCKNLRQNIPQITLSFDALINHLRSVL